ncbi:MAG: hypothetical protein CR975_06565 [Gammaproteobacteria bacterium]|nr:MAG: hypothetical protein CR975_06565 [Gammaproteobacteria bacterium]
MHKHQRILMFLSALFGAASVSLAAVGAHAFYETLVANGQVEIFAKAVDYAMYGALALLGVVALTKCFRGRCFIVAGYLLALGTVLFSGSLFLHTLAGIQAVTAVTPVGGTLLIVAWLYLAVSAFRLGD